jgi:glycosidase
VHEADIGNYTPSLSYEGVSLIKVNKGNNSNYLFIDLNIEKNTKPGAFTILFTPKEGEVKKYEYELKARNTTAENFIGFDSSDAIYLITPDRFANGNSANDIVAGLEETKIDRENDYARHGGDIKGIIKHLDYIDEMGFTAIWSCPVVINDMKEASYHGYAMTDFYTIDPRFGNLDDYVQLSQKAKEKGIKLIMDQVANHCGITHWWMSDLPFADWINQQQSFEEKQNIKHSNHRRTANQDIYASEKDKNDLNDGWFVDAMPDLNQRNPFMAAYLIQNSIWWIETAELSGIRQDTYPYSDKAFMAKWAGAIMNEYPNFSIVGEEWSYNPLLIGYWQKGAANKDGYESNLRSTMDFAMQRNIVTALNENESWDNGLIKIYEGLANDFHYTSPKDIMIFADNHDMSRIYTQLGEDIAATKMAVCMILSMPRIPQLYYGTEILMNDSAKPGDHGLIRSDFPGGWEGDSVNAFTGEGLTDAQKDMQTFVKNLLNYRKNSKAIQRGKTTHFAPENGIYVLVRSFKEERVVLILNKNEHPVVLDLNRFSELNLQGKTLYNIDSQTNVNWGESLELNNKGAILLSTKID